MHSKRKIPDSWRTGGKAKACTSFVLYFKVFKNNLYYLWHVGVLSIKPCLHTQLAEHNKSYRKVSQGWGHLITWNGPVMGHLNSFSASGGGNLNKNFPKIQMPGGLPGGGGCWSFDLTGTLHLLIQKILTHVKQVVWSGPAFCIINWNKFSRTAVVVVSFNVQAID